MEAHSTVSDMPRLPLSLPGPQPARRTFLGPLALQRRHRLGALLAGAPHLIHVHHGGCHGGRGRAGLPGAPFPPDVPPLAPRLPAPAASAAPLGLRPPALLAGGPAATPPGLSGGAPRPPVHPASGRRERGPCRVACGVSLGDRLERGRGRGAGAGAGDGGRGTGAGAGDGGGAGALLPVTRGSGCSEELWARPPTGVTFHSECAKPVSRVAVFRMCFLWTMHLTCRRGPVCLGASALLASLREQAIQVG